MSPLEYVVSVRAGRAAEIEIAMLAKLVAHVRGIVEPAIPAGIVLAIVEVVKIAIRVQRTVEFVVGADKSENKELLMTAIRWLFLVFFSALALSCSGGATVPAPIAETPSLQFPESVTIDVGTIQQGTPATLMGQAFLVTPGGPLSDEISFGGDIADFGQQLVDLSLQPLSQFQIPSSTSQLTFEANIRFDDPFTPEVLAQNVNIKIDFADYDFDNDGSDEGCSGSTAALPICFRIWYDGIQRMAGVFTQIPVPGNSGAGSFKVPIHGVGDSFGDTALIAVNYDHLNPFDKNTEVFEEVIPSGKTPETALQDLSVHFVISQDGSDISGKKLLNLSGQGLNNSPTPFKEARYIGQWREDGDFWSGTTQVDPPQSSGNLTNQCAVIATGESANRQHCLDEGIDVAGISFVDFLQVSDVLPPIDFPLTPTF